MLILNAGCSTLKFSLYDGGQIPARRFSGTLDRIGSSGATFTLKDSLGDSLTHETIDAATHEIGLEYLLKRLAERTNGKPIHSVGHRIVYGGPCYREPQLVDTAMLEELARIQFFDPEHLPSEIALMKSMATLYPNVPQVACFDTAFHRTMSRVATQLPLPRRYESQGLQRYGFHGLSCEYLMQELERLAGKEAAHGRIILAHLGNGASMTAVSNGQSLDTTMAFTPAAGLMMSTRTGDIDPGIASYLMRSEGMTAAQYDHLINHESGLKGVSETSSDMRDLLAIEATDHRAAEAITLFCYQAKKSLGALTTVLGGLDTVIFSGGIGENAAPVRSRICEGLSYLGIELDEARNAAHEAVISANASRVTLRVIKTDEELIIAQSVARVLPR